MEGAAAAGDARAAARAGPPFGGASPEAQAQVEGRGLEGPELGAGRASLGARARAGIFCRLGDRGGGLRPRRSSLTGGPKRRRGWRRRPFEARDRDDAERAAAASAARAGFVGRGAARELLGGRRGGKADQRVRGPMCVLRGRPALFAPRRTCSLAPGTGGRPRTGPAGRTVGRWGAEGAAVRRRGDNEPPGR